MSSPTNSGLRCADTKFDVNVPSWYREGWQRFQFDVHNFTDLPAIENNAVGPPITFQYLGRDIEVEIFLNGHPGVPPVEGRISRPMVVRVRRLSGPRISVQLKMNTRANCSDFDRAPTIEYTPETVATPFLLHGYGYQSMKSKPGEFLRDGTFTLSLYLKQIGSPDKPSVPFIPRNPCNQSMLKFFDAGEHRDIWFEVKKSDGDEPTNIYCHRLVLQACAPDIGEMCEQYTDLTPVPINGVDPEIFRAMLRYVYGGEAPSGMLRDRAIDLIEVAHKFGVSNLKVEAEAAYVNTTTITAENVVGNFYLADTTKCALLKERVMDFLVANGRDVLSTISFDDVPESQTMFADFLTAVTRGNNDDEECDEDDPARFKIMSVNDLRRTLYDRGLNIDGTREMMVSALEESYAAENERKRKRDDDAAEAGIEISAAAD